MPEIRDTLKSFLEMFKEYAKEVYGEYRPNRLDELRTQLQQTEPQVTKYVLYILGDATFTLGHGSMVSRRDLLSTALLGGNNELPHNFRHYESLVTSVLNRAIGTIEAGLWPPQEPTPVLVINDNELRQCCWDLLSGSGNYDRVIREATTVLENRIRTKCPYDRLSRLIPQSADQTGEKLVNKLFAPDNPVLSISSDRLRRIELHRMLLGVFSYLRNPYHHSLHPTTEWSWAWSAVGLIDRLLSDIETCVVME